jgi:hypothetical protein
MIPVQPAVIEIQNLYYGYYEYGIKNGLKNAHLYPGETRLSSHLTVARHQSSHFHHA